MCKLGRFGAYEEIPEDSLSTWDRIKRRAWEVSSLTHETAQKVLKPVFEGGGTHRRREGLDVGAAANLLAAVDHAARLPFEDFTVGAAFALEHPQRVDHFHLQNLLRGLVRQGRTLFFFLKLYLVPRTAVKKRPIHTFERRDLPERNLQHAPV